MMVELEGMPKRCAVVTTRAQSAVLILPGEMTLRMPSSRISAAVPGRLSRPAYHRR